MEAVLIIFDIFLLSDTLKVICDIFHTYSVKIEYLTARKDGRQYLMFLCSCQDKFRIGRRLFYCLQKGIESLCRQHMHLINAVNLVTACFLWHSHLLNQANYIF